MALPSSVRTYQVTSLWEACQSHAAGTFAMWPHNRHLDDARADRIAAALRAQARPDIGPQPLVIAVTGGAQYLIDGQHRLAAGSRLEEPLARAIEVLISREPCPTDADVRRMFKLVNCGTPVPMAFFDDDVAQFAGRLAALVAEQWPGAESKNPTAQRPRFVRARLVVTLGDSPPTREGAAAGRLDPAEALAEATTMNDEAREYFTAPTTKTGARRAHQLRGEALIARAEASGFFLGLYLDWPNQLMARLGEAWRARELDP